MQARTALYCGAYNVARSSTAVPNPTDQEMSLLEIKRWNQSHADFVANPYKSVWDIQVDSQRESKKKFMGKAFCVTPHDAAVAKREVEMQKTFIVSVRFVEKE